MPIHIRNGTLPDKRLCDTCTRSHIMQGVSGDERIICYLYSYPMEIKTRVVSCNSYRALKDSAKPSLSAMEDMAFILTHDTPLKTAGFVHSREWRKKHKDEDILPEHIRYAT